MGIINVKMIGILHDQYYFLGESYSDITRMSRESPKVLPYPNKNDLPLIVTLVSPDFHDVEICYDPPQQKLH